MFERLKIKLDTARMLGSAEIEIWVEDGKLHYKKDLFSTMLKLSEINPDGTYRLPWDDSTGVSEVPVEEFSKKMESLHIEVWKKNYEPIGYAVEDGESWDLQYETEEGKQIKVSGNNAYPKEWNKLVRCIRSVVGDTGEIKMKNGKNLHSGFEAPTIGTVLSEKTVIRRNPDGTISISEEEA